MAHTLRRLASSRSFPSSYPRTKLSVTQEEDEEDESREREENEEEEKMEEEEEEEVDEGKEENGNESCRNENETGGLRDEKMSTLQNCDVTSHKWTQGSDGEGEGSPNQRTDSDPNDPYCANIPIPTTTTTTTCGSTAVDNQIACRSNPVSAHNTHEMYTNPIPELSDPVSNFLQRSTSDVNANIREPIASNVQEPRTSPNFNESSTFNFHDQAQASNFHELGTSNFREPMTSNFHEPETSYVHDEPMTSDFHEQVTSNLHDEAATSNFGEPAETTTVTAPKPPPPHNVQPLLSTVLRKQHQQGRRRSSAFDKTDSLGFQVDGQSSPPGRGSLEIGEGEEKEEGRDSCDGGGGDGENRFFWADGSGDDDKAKCDSGVISSVPRNDAGGQVENTREVKSVDMVPDTEVRFDGNYSFRFPDTSRDVLDLQRGSGERSWSPSPRIGKNSTANSHEDDDVFAAAPRPSTSDDITTSLVNARGINTTIADDDKSKTARIQSPDHDSNNKGRDSYDISTTHNNNNDMSTSGNGENPGGGGGGGGQFVFQKPFPVPESAAPKTTTTTATTTPGSGRSAPPPPLFRRQLSKRKSETNIPDLLANVKDADRKALRSDEPGDYDLDDDEEDDEEEFHSLGSVCHTPTSPKAPRMETYDPYQYFEVQHTPCLILTVRVLRARNVTLGFRDYYDTPDPYINLVMRSSPEGRKSTTVKEDEPNPEWDESFTFFVNFTQANVLEISLMEYNLLWYHQVVGTVHFDLIHINQMDVFQYETFVFNDVTEVDIEFKLEFDRYPTLRYSLCLSDAEKQFIERRKAKAMEGVCNLIGEEDGPVNINEVPTVAVLGSGGGFRAMTAYSGVVKALKESGVLDCVTYACGLSGSSWLLSTLYSHPKWPNVDMAEFQEEMKQNIDKRLLRFFTPATMYKYTSYLVKKRREKQPVSFTDIFGRMVGETLLSGRMNATLTDQRETIKDGDIPMPLYTCVHVKKDVPARQFQEWVEFSPYEIGMPKYGTFMDSELFGSKFFMGKLVKKFDEQPLHFLQGIWGSAFCILFKRLLEDNRRLDPAEMMRREMGEQMLREEIGQELDEARGESSSDCSDDEIDFDSQSSIDSDAGATTGEENFRKESSVESTSSLDSQNSQDFNRVSDERRSSSQSLPTVEESNPNAEDKNGLVFNNPANDDEEEGKSGNESDMEDDEDEEDDELFKSCRFENRKGSVEMRKIEKMKQGSEELESQAPGNKLLDVVAENNEESEDAKKSVRWGACPTRGNVSKEKREAFRRASSSMRKSRSGSKSYWQQYLKSMVESKWELFSTRRGRAAVIHNFMRGLSLQQTYPLSPFTPVEKRVKEGDEFDGIFEMHPTSVKHLYMVDAGLTFNSPYPLVLRPQRQVDVILSFDFSARPSDQHQPFKELLLAEKWARLNRLPFPPIDASVFDREGMKELYIFRHPTDPHCPVVLHFVLINKDFRHYKKPGVPRETKEEFDFADFDIFDNPKAPYSTFNFTYSHENFERLSKLTEFNTLLHIEEIKQVIRDVVRLKREGPPRIPIQSKDIKLLRMKSVQEYRKLKKFISRMESRSSISTPFGTPGVQASPSTNPFFSDLKQDKLSRSSTCSSEQRHWPDRLSESHNSGLNSHRSSRNRGRRSPLSSTSSCDSVFGTPPQDQVPTFGAPGQPHNLQRQSSRGVPSNVDSSHVTGQKNSNSRQMPLFGSSAAETGILSNSCPQSSVMRDVTDSRSHPENGRHDAVPVVTATTTPAQNFDMLDSGTSLVLDDQSPSSCPSSLSPSTPHAIPSPNEAPKSPAGSSPKLKMPPLLPPPNVAQTLSSSSGSSKSFTPTSTPSTAQNTPKPKSKKELPPNPFFVNAHFMRSAYNSSSSSEGGDSEDKGKNYRLTTGSSYRRSKPSPLANGLPSHSSANTERSESNTSASSSENNHITRGSPAGLSTFHSRNLESHPELVYESSPSQTESVEGTNTQTSVTSQEPSTASPTSDDFSLAPEAFKLDGTPVTDRAQAKMFYEEAKKKRALFRRQSTVSSLNSISLEDRCQSQEVGEQDIQRASSGDSVTEIRPVASDGHHLFQDAFHSCDEGAPTSVTKEDVISMEISNLSQFQAVGSP